MTSSNANFNQKYLRVTEILYPFSGLQKIDPYVLNRAANRGTRVHNACEHIVTTKTDPEVDDETRGYVHSFKQWWREDFDVQAVEKRFFCDELMITGQCDLILDLEDGVAIVDLKTSAQPSKTWELQGSAYIYLAQKSGFNATKSHFIQLNKHGMEPKVYTYNYNFDLFKKTLDVYNYFFRKKDEGTYKELL